MTILEDAVMAKSIYKSEILSLPNVVGVGSRLQNQRNPGVRRDQRGRDGPPEASAGQPARRRFYPT